MNTIAKALVIGIGSIGRRHTEILAKILGKNNIGVVSKKEKLELDSFQSRYYELSEISSKELNIYDYFVICSPTFQHYFDLEYINERVQDKVILVEKPLFNSFNRTMRLKNKVLVAYNLRFYPLFQKVLDLCRDKKIYFASAEATSYLPYWREHLDYRECYSAKKNMGGGVLLDLSHELDYIQKICGNIENFYSYNEKISELEIDSDDVLSLIGKTDKGIMVQIYLSYFSRIPKRLLCIEGENFSVCLDFVNHTLQYIDESEEIRENHKVDINDSYTSMHTAILGGSYQDCCNFDEGLQLMKLIEDIKNKSA